MLKKSGFSITSVSETIKNEEKEQKSKYLNTLLGTLAASLLGNLLTGKRVKRSKVPVHWVMTAGEGTFRDDQDF